MPAFYILTSVRCRQRREEELGDEVQAYFDVLTGRLMGRAYRRKRRGARRGWSTRARSK